MFDVVKYTTNKINREFLVEDHVDPGLFSFSLFSNAPGLEMLELETKEWIPIPPNYGVIWCGLAAIEVSERTLQGGYHRVKTYMEYPRITCWYEVCVESQLLKENFIHGLKKKEMSNEDDKILISTNIDSVDNSFDIYVETFRGFKLKININPDMSVSELKQLIELKCGIPLGKQSVSTTLLDGIGEKMENDEKIKTYGLKENEIIKLDGSLSDLVSNRYLRLFKAMLEGTTF